MRTLISGESSSNQSSGSRSKLSRVNTRQRNDSREKREAGTSTRGLLSTMSWVSEESLGVKRSGTSLVRWLLTNSMLRKLLHLPTDESMSTMFTFLNVTLLKFGNRLNKLLFNEMVCGEALGLLAVLLDHKQNNQIKSSLIQITFLTKINVDERVNSFAVQKKKFNRKNVWFEE